MLTPFGREWPPSWWGMHGMLAGSIVVLATIAGPTPPPTPPPTSAPPTTVPAIPAAAWAAFDDALEERLLRGSNHAAGVAVSIGGEVVHTASFGTRTPDDAEPVAVTDRFRIASISKVITATVVLQLVADGEISLDEPVGDRLTLLAGVPYTDPDVQSITVRQLLSHTSGMPKYRSEFFDGTFDSCPAAAAHGMSRRLADPPGTRHTYSNLNYCLLTLLIEHLTGSSYEDAVIDLLLDPLGITGMRLAGTHDARAGDVVHRAAEGRTYMEALGGAGAWIASPGDVVRILAALDETSPGWRPLPPDLAALMRTPLTEISYPEPDKRTYGLGMILWPDGSWGHTGTVENTRAMVSHRPDGVTWAILVSGPRPNGTEDLAGVFNRSLGDAAITFAAARQGDDPADSGG